jgi:3-oxoadipate enol-lactonase
VHTVDWVQANGTWLRFAEDGASVATAKGTVVLVHEMGGTLDSWDEVVPYLADRYRVLRYDMRGFGLSQKIFGPYNIDDAISDLVGFIDEMKVQGPLALVGGAVGGGVSMRVAAKIPKRVGALVALAPATEIAPERQDAARATPGRIAELGIRRMVDEGIAPRSYPEHLRDSPGRFRRFLAQQSSMDPESFAATYGLLLDGQYLQYLSAIACPTLVIAGEFDNIRPPATVEPVARAIPGARFEVIPACHYMAVQAPDLVGKKVADFLKESLR